MFKPPPFSFLLPGVLRVPPSGRRAARLLLLLGILLVGAAAAAGRSPGRAVRGVRGAGAAGGAGGQAAVGGAAAQAGQGRGVREEKKAIAVNFFSRGVHELVFQGLTISILISIYISVQAGQGRVREEKTVHAWKFRKKF